MAEVALTKLSFYDNGKMRTRWVEYFDGTALITSSISDGDTTHSPDGNSIFDALALKAPLDDPTFTGIISTPDITVTNLTDNYIPYHKSDALGFDDSTLFYDATGAYCGSGTAGFAPATRLHIGGTAATDIVRTDIGIDLNPVVMPANSAITASATTGEAGLEVGTYTYRVTYVTALGETDMSSAGKSVTTTLHNQHVDLSNLPVSTDYRVISKNIYRGAVGVGATMKLIGNVLNAVTTYHDEATDASISALADFYSRANTTSTYITLNSNRAILLGVGVTSLGLLAGGNVTTAGRCTFIGYNAGAAVTSGGYNTFVGLNAGAGVTTKSSQVAIGAYCLNTTAGDYNVAAGVETGYKLTGTGNVLIGHQVGTNSVAADYNVMVGFKSGYTNISGDTCVFIGSNSGYYETASNVLVIDNVKRGTTQAEGPPLYLIYGTFAATAAAQTLRFNAAVTVSESLTMGASADSKSIIFGAGSDMDIMYDGTNGNIRTDLVAASDLHIDCGTAKTVVLDIPVYNDANVGSLVLQTGGTLPGIVEILDNDGDATGIYTRGFAVNEQGSGVMEVPHDYKEGTDIVFHIHWGIQDAPTGTDKVKWQLIYSIQRDANTFPDSITPAAVEVNVTTQYNWVRTDLATITGATGGVDGGAIKIGDQFHFTLKRIAASADEFGGEGLMATIGFHYQCDTIGSRGIGTK